MKQLLLTIIFIFILAVISHTVNSQSVINPGGSCVNPTSQSQYNLTIGGLCPSNPTVWTINAPAGSYTRGSSDNNNLYITWNTAVTGATITATYYLLPGCVSDHRSITVNVTGAPATPAAPSGISSRCQGPGTSQFTTTVNSQVGYIWEIANAGSSTISSSGSTATVTWDSNFFGTAVVSVRASASCAISPPASSSVTVTQAKTYSLEIHGPTSQNCFQLSAVNFTAVANSSQLDPSLGNLTYQWHVASNLLSGSNYSQVINNLTTAVSVGDNVYCVASSDATCVASITSATYTVPAPADKVNPKVNIRVPQIDYCPGETIIFTASSANIDGSSSYIWRKNGDGILGMSNSITLQASTTYGTGTFSLSDVVTVEVSNLSGCLTSSSATGTTLETQINIFPEADTPTGPFGKTLRCQGDGTDSYVSSGTSAYQHIWSISNAGNSTIDQTGIVNWDPNFYGTATISILAQERCGPAKSASIAVTVNQTKTYSLEIHGPSSQDCFQLSSANFTAVANESQPDPALGNLTYQWHVDGNLMSVPNYSQVINTITANVSVGISVYCVASSDKLCVPSVPSAHFIVPAPVTPVIPTVSIHVSDSMQVPKTNYCSGEKITFTVSSDYITSSSTYVWRKNRDLILGYGTSITTQIGVSAFNPDLGDNITVDVNNLSGGCISSTAATGTTAGIPFIVTPSVTPTVTIYSDDVANSVCVGTSLSFGAIISNGGSTPSLQWRVHSSDIESATGNFFTTTATYTGQQIDCILTSNATCATLATATSNPLVVTTLPSVGTPGIIQGPISTNQQGTSSYTVSASNAQSYNWSINPSTAGSIAADGVVTWSNETVLNSATITVTANGCNGPSPVSTKQITLLSPLSGGVILSGNITINAGSNPGRIVATLAYGGSCNGSYQYQWQQSDSPSGPFTDILGSTDKTCFPGAISVTTYFQRKVICANDVAFSNTIVVMTGAVSTENQNYVRERTINRSGITNFSAAGQLTDPHDVAQTTSYFDGLGAPTQTIAKQASPLTGDIVSMRIYDPFRRESVILLPYTETAGDGNFKSNAANNQYNFNLTQFPAEKDYYKQTIFELSPLNRPLKQGAPGSIWQPDADLTATTDKTIKHSYETNTSNEVLLFSYDNTTGMISATANNVTTYYDANQLFANKTKDEHDNEVIEYVDKEGHTICKKVQYGTDANSNKLYASTYYIYDDLGNLVVVLPPEGVKQFLAQN